MLATHMQQRLRRFAGFGGFGEAPADRDYYVRLINCANAKGGSYPLPPSDLANDAAVANWIGDLFKADAIHGAKSEQWLKECEPCAQGTAACPTGSAWGGLAIAAGLAVVGYLLLR